MIFSGEMATSAHYLFEEVWDIPGFDAQAVYSVISDAKLLPVWWRDVYLSSEPLDGDIPHEGARAKVHAKGFLPYTLKFTLTATRLEPNSLVETVAEGDFDGKWSAIISDYEGGTKVAITWDTEVKKPLIKWLSPILRPLFRWNHNWTTKKGEVGLRAYLQMQRSNSGSVV